MIIFVQKYLIIAPLDLIRGKDHLIWRIGLGSNISVFSQPWFPNWNQFRASNKIERDSRVITLIDESTHNWDFQQLQ